MKKIVMMSSVFLAAATAAAAQTELPERILSGYTGMNLDGKSSHVEKMIRELAGYKFNSIEVKIQHKFRSMDLRGHADEVARLAKLANEKGLIFQIYLYPIPYDGIRRREWAEHAKLPAPVDAEGNTVENAFNLSDPAVWKQLFGHAFQFAGLRGTIPFTALKFDIETVSHMYSYDDATWQKFCAVNPDFPVAAAPSERAGLLDSRKAAHRYQAFFEREVEKAVKEFAAGLHEIDPALILGYMPAHHGWISNVFNRSLATDATPAIIDGWDLYNGEGYTKRVAEHAERVRKAHKNNLFIPWLRPNSYEPDDITVGAYYSAANCDGYSLWVLTMLDDDTNKQRGYDLPGGKNAAVYLEAFKRANEAVDADLKEKTIGTPKRIAYRQAKALVAPLDYSHVTVPELLPAGTGDGKTPRLVLRDQQTIFLYAKAGGELKIALSHLAGNARAVALHYALFDQAGKGLREEAVSVGARDEFTVIAPHTGTYALVVSGGVGGQAGYGVEVFTPYFAVDAREKAYFFGPQTVYVAGKDAGNPELLLSMQPNESHARRINDTASVEVNRSEKNPIALPAGTVKVAFAKPKTGWSQNFWLSFPKGKVPFIYGHPERRLVPAK